MAIQRPKILVWATFAAFAATAMAILLMQADNTGVQVDGDRTIQPPMGMVATQAGDYVELAWQKPSALSVDGYRITRQTDGSTTFITENTGKKKTRYTKTDVPAGAHSYRVYSVKDGSAAPTAQTRPSTSRELSPQPSSKLRPAG